MSDECKIILIHLGYSKLSQFAGIVFPEKWQFLQEQLA